jgi:hypothetical protein
MDIKILGTGCAKCQQTEKLVREVVAETGADAQIDKVTDIKSIIQYGVMLQDSQEGRHQGLAGEIVTKCSRFETYPGTLFPGAGNHNKKKENVNE